MIEEEAHKDKAFKDRDEKDKDKEKVMQAREEIIEKSIIKSEEEWLDCKFSNENTGRSDLMFWFMLQVDPIQRLTPGTKSGVLPVSGDFC